MFGDIFGQFSCGQIKEAHGKTWIVIKHIRDGHYLAVEEGSAFPSDVKLILVESEYNAAVERKKKVEEDE